MSDKGMLEIIAEMRAKPLCVLLDDETKMAFMKRYAGTTLGKFLNDWSSQIPRIRMWIQLDGLTPTYRVAKTIYNKGQAYDMTFAFDGSFISGDKELLKYIEPELFKYASQKVLAKGQSKQRTTTTKER